MQEITLDYLEKLAARAKDAITQNALNAGHDTPKIYLHWTAGWYETTYDDYHINIGEYGNIYASTDDLSETLSHTWRRNTGSIGVALCCCAGATTEDLGEAPPTYLQVEAMAKVIAALCNGLEIPITKYTVLTHGEAADNYDEDECGYGVDDCYGVQNGCERWDLQYLGTAESPYFTNNYENPITGGNVLRGKANYYLENGYE